ncbi:MAG: nitroreductase family protein [Clostridia bacterium]|nr:nitroreductase family protein [Clostridia bacterium]
MANEMMKRWYNAAKTRASVREYSGKVPKEMFYRLKNFAESLDNGDARIEFKSKSGVLERPRFLSFLGGVGGTNCFAAIIVRDDNKFMGGYIGEAFVLECVSMGLGTCWLGGTYKKGALKNYFDLDEDEKLLCVISVGRAADKPQPAEKKTIEKLTGLSEVDFNELPKWQQSAIEIARLAPSALNKQPWELEIERDYIRIINTKRNFGFGDVDCGIAMLHIEIGAAACGVHGDWFFDGEDGEARFVPFADRLNVFADEEHADDDTYDPEDDFEE